jgi:hypothetical protein
MQKSLVRGKLMVNGSNPGRVGAGLSGLSHSNDACMHGSDMQGSIQRRGVNK